MEFNAIIFCGKGAELSPFSAMKETGTTKALLPIANKPMLQYVLEWCDQAPFKTVTVVCGEESLDAISGYIKKYSSMRSTELTNTSNLSCISCSGTTTGSILHQVLKTQKFLYKEDVVLLPCDFITDVPAQVFIEMYRQNSDQNLGLAVAYRNIFENIDTKALRTNYTVYANQADGNTVLLDIYSEKYVAMTKFLRLRTQQLWRYPETKVSMKLLDSFIFFASGQIFDIVDNKEAGYIDTENRSANKIKRDIARRSWSHSSAKETVGLVILPEGAVFARANNLPVYMECNRMMLKDAARANSQKRQMRAASTAATANKNAAVVGADCILGANTELGDHTNVKRSVIGSNCTIGKKCRITACVVMDGVTLDDEVHLENCIIGNGAKLEHRCRLVNCNVEGSYIVGENVSLKGETLTNISLDEINAAMREDSSDDDDEQLAVDSDAVDSDESGQFDSGSFDSEFVFAN